MGSDAPDGQELIAVEVEVRGYVQGVFFRVSTRDIAQQQGVVGWVRNEPDGRVRAHFEGERDDVDAVLAWVRRGGPRMARVDEVVVRDAKVEGHPRFGIE